VVEDVTGYLDWGTAVIDDNGIVRPADPDAFPPYLTADNAEASGHPRACCESRECGHQWRLRRKFDPTRATSTGAGQ
jgi:hypothetical protein